MPRRGEIDWDRIDLSDEEERELEDCYQAASKSKSYGHNKEQVIRDCMEDDLGFPRGFSFPRKARSRVDEESKQAGVKLTTEDNSRILKIVEEGMTDREIEGLNVVHGDQLGLYLRAIIKSEVQKMTDEIKNRDQRSFKIPLKQLQAPAGVTVPSDQKRRSQKPTSRKGR